MSNMHIHAWALFQHLQVAWYSSGGFSLAYSVTNIFLGCTGRYCSCIYLDMAWDQISRDPGWLEQPKLCLFDKYKCLSRKLKFWPRNQNASTRTTIHKPSTICASNVYAIRRRPWDGLDSQWWLVSQVLEVETKVWEYFRLSACNAFWVKEVQETCSMEWWVWYGSVCFMVLAIWWT